MKNSANEPRRVGFELEFGNLSVRETAEALQSRLGGELQEINPFVFNIINSSVGRLKIERDAEILNSAKYREALKKMNIDFNPGTVVNDVEKGIDSLSSFLIPCEVVTEPLTFEEFPKLDEIVIVLNTLSAEGTQDSILNAFGLHINPSVPDLSSTTLVSYIQSFLLLSDWIIADSGTDLTRRFFTSFVDPFPTSYHERILDPHYTPELEIFIDDYLEFNPTRNRALDMLPILCEIDRDRVLAGVNQEERSLITARPAFHYRLPDCRLGDENWSIADEWNHWWYVETVASDKSSLAELIRLWNENVQQSWLTRKNEWIDTVKNFLNQHIEIPDGLHE